MLELRWWFACNYIAEKFFKKKTNAINLVKLNFKKLKRRNENYWKLKIFFPNLRINESNFGTKYTNSVNDIKRKHSIFSSRITKITNFANKHIFIANLKLRYKQNNWINLSEISSRWSRFWEW